MKLGVISLGCDKATVDSERLVGELVGHGAVITQDLPSADVILVNTCGFIDAAKQESIDAILGAAKLKQDGDVKAVVAVGCLVQRYKQELTAEIPEVDLFLGFSELHHLVPELAQRGLITDPVAAHPGVRQFLGDQPHVRFRDMVRYYTREAGVRRLEQEIAKVCRKVVKELLINKTSRIKAKNAQDLEKPAKKISVSAKNLDKYLGVYRYDYGVAAKENQVGQVTGLAWTSVGGELLTIEAVMLPGKGKTITTGKLGDVMQESVQAAMSVVRSRAKRLGISEDFYEKKDIHIHLPEGATPKDGPSAGIGLTTALVSVLTGIPARADVAMTGEITLRGEVLPIGGLKEKLLAAHRGGIKTVLIPESNVKDLVDIPENIKSHLQIHPVKWIDQVLELALETLPQPLEDKPVEIVSVGAELGKDEKVPVTH